MGPSIRFHFFENVVLTAICKVVYFLPGTYFYFASVLLMNTGMYHFYFVYVHYAMHCILSFEYAHAVCLYVLDSHLINCGFCLIGRGGPKQHYIIMSILRQNTRIIIKELNRLQWVSGNIYYNMKPDYWGGQAPMLDYWGGGGGGGGAVPPVGLLGGPCSPPPLPVPTPL